MSMWTYIRGIIEVCPFGRTQAEDEYILKTVLSHLPKVTGNKNDMCFDIIQSKCYCTARRSTVEFRKPFKNGIILAMKGGEINFREFK